MGDGSSEDVRVILTSVGEGGGGRVVGCSSAGEVGRGGGDDVCESGFGVGVGTGEVRELTDVWEGGGVGDGVRGVMICGGKGGIRLRFRVSRRGGKVSKGFGRRRSRSDFR